MAFILYILYIANLYMRVLYLFTFVFISLDIFYTYILLPQHD